MSSTVADLYEKAARIIGARVGTLGTVTVGASTTTAILKGLVNTNAGDNTAFAGDRLFFLASADGSRETSISAWVDLTGTATFTNLTAAPVAGATYILVSREDYSLYEFQLALEKALDYSGRLYRQVVPLTPNLDMVPLDMCDWLHGAGDIYAAWLSQSPIWLHNEDMALWQNGPSAAPDGYTLTDLGTGGTITRQSGGMRSAYKAHIEAGSGIVRLEQSVPGSLVAWASTRTQTAPLYYPVRPWGWVSTPDASSVRVYVYDGTTRHYTDYFTATSNGVPEMKETSLTPAATQTAYTWGLEVAAGAECDLHVAGEIQNTQTVTLTYSLSQQGSQAFRELRIPLNRRNLGGVPTVELPMWPGGWYQLIAYVRRPFAQLSSPTDYVDDQYVPALVAGLVRYLLEPVKPNQDRARLDPIMKRNASDWSRQRTNFLTIPVPVPDNQWNVTSA
jgi:hypothetical protein